MKYPCQYLNWGLLFLIKNKGSAYKYCFNANFAKSTLVVMFNVLSLKLEFEDLDYASDLYNQANQNS